MAGLDVVPLEQLRALPRLDCPEAMMALQLDASIGAVVVGWDPDFNYARLMLASACLRELPGCGTLVATNRDAGDNIGGVCGARPRSQRVPTCV